nr:MAG TPA: hypothetical protein [Caudoviricetes sp.]
MEENVKKTFFQKTLDFSSPPCYNSLAGERKGRRAETVSDSNLKSE